MHAHAHLGVVGVFVLLIMGVSFKLVPMFALGDIQNTRRAGWSIALVNVGLLGTVVAILVQSAWKMVFGMAIIAGLIIYAMELLAILRVRKRRSLDAGMKSFLIALALLVPLSLIGLVLAWPGLPMTAFTSQLETVYGFVAIVGVVGLAILGMLCKIMPFLIWYRSYSRQVGRAQVPSLGDMSLPRWQAAGCGVFLVALFTLSGATVLGSEPGVRTGAVLLAAGLACYAVNFAHVLLHWVRPQVKPLISPAPQPRSS
jgi:amino acid transporter